MLTRRISLCVLLVFVLAAVSCGSPRPPLSEWSDAWEEIKAAVPHEEALRESGRAACERLLVATRSMRSRLLPTPDRALDAAVHAWLEEAGGIAFDCPSARDDDADLHRRFLELRVLTAAVDAAAALEKDLVTE